MLYLLDNHLRLNYHPNLKNDFTASLKANTCRCICWLYIFILHLLLVTFYCFFVLFCFFYQKIYEQVLKSLFFMSLHFPAFTFPRYFSLRNVIYKHTSKKPYLDQKTKHSLDPESTYGSPKGDSSGSVMK